MGDPQGGEVAPRTRDQLWRLLFFAAAALLLVGLGFDRWGSSDGTGSELAHSVVIVGGTVTILAAVILLLAPVFERRAARGGGWRVLQVAVPVLAVGVLGPAMVAAASASTSTNRGSTADTTATATDAAAHAGHTDPAPTGAAADAAAATGAFDESQPHTHDANGNSVPITVPTDANGNVSPGAALGAEIVGNATSNGGHEHGVAVPEQPVDEPTRQLLGQQLTIARQAAEQFPTVADAVAAGYRMVTPFVPLIGAHYINFSLVDGTFDPAHPEMLLYNGTDPTSQIVGLSYFVASPNGAPDGFAGPNDHWHQHIGLCIKNSVVVGGETTTPEECAKRGGTKVGLNNMWMVHAWVVPGWDSPQGVFSPEHSGLV
jgi:hypothetical protein